MKGLVLVVVLLAVCLLLFIAGVVSPNRSKKMQAGVDKLSKKGEGKGDRSAGKLGDATSAALEKSREAADASARAGRAVNDKITAD